MLRLRKVGRLYDGTGADATILDLMVKNTTYYMPWASDQTGRGTDQTLAQVSLAAGQEATFLYRLIANDYACPAGADCDPPAVEFPYRALLPSLPFS